MGLARAWFRVPEKNCDVQGLEHDMEEINARWNTLNKRWNWTEGIEKRYGNFRFHGTWMQIKLQSSSNLELGKGMRRHFRTLPFLTLCLWSSCTKNHCSARGFVALWEVQRCLGAIAQLVELRRLIANQKPHLLSIKWVKSRSGTEGKRGECWGSER